MVPANWKHPKRKSEYSGETVYVPLLEPALGGGYSADAQEWDEAWEMWQKGLSRAYGGGPSWVPVDPEYSHMRYTEYSGPRPSPDDYMPNWPAEERTHFMMYETTSEGTPISPAFATAEELAEWLAATNASSFGSMTATYDQWLSTIKRGSAISVVMAGGQLVSGVEGLHEAEAHKEGQK